MTSLKIEVIRFAVSLSMILLVAMIPPKALTVSHLYASSHALLNELALATPQGFACFIIATVGSENSLTSFSAASVSFTLL